MIFETIIVSQDLSGKPHITPFGIRYEGKFVVISPYKPSTTLDNILTTKYAVMNLTDDVRVFAGALTNRKTWPLLEANKIGGFSLTFWFVILCISAKKSASSNSELNAIFTISTPKSARH